MHTNIETSVIITNKNGLQFLPGCLNALAKQTYKNFEVILVDNGSIDGSVEYVREHHPDVRILRFEHNLGFGGGNNAGIRASRSRFIVLLNNDTEADSNWLGELVHGIESDHSLAMCASKLVFADKPNVVDSAGDEIFWFGPTFTYRYFPADHPAVTTSRHCFSACAGAAIYRREVLDKIGLFNEIYSPAYYEDIDLGFRAQLHGYEVKYIPSAVVRHKVSGTVKRNSDLFTYLNQRNAEYLFFINFPTKLLFIALPFRMFYLAVIFIVFCLKGKAMPILRAKIDFLGNMKQVMNSRKLLFSMVLPARKILEKKMLHGWLRHKMYMFGSGYRTNISA